MTAQDHTQEAIRRTVVVIPAYNEHAVIREVVTEVAALGCEVCVVDDGSRDGTAAALEHAPCVLIRHAINRGQGAALQTGLTYAIRHGADFVVTFDGDGQHDPADIAAMLGPIASGTADVIFGSRFLGSATGISWARRLVLRIGVIGTRVLTGLLVTDTHNGLRALTRAAAQAITLRGDGMAHASEFYDQVARADLRFAEVPVSVRYTEYSRAKGQTTLNVFRVAGQYLLLRLFR
ncbi:MAG: glycosyltransferase family 2 protein [Planctomycetota bacterium]